MITFTQILSESNVPGNSQLSPKAAADIMQKNNTQNIAPQPVKVNSGPPTSEVLQQTSQTGNHSAVRAGTNSNTTIVNRAQISKPYVQTPTKSLPVGSRQNPTAVASRI